MLERRHLRAIGLTSYALGYASVIFGYSLLCHFTYVSAYYILGDPTRHGGPSWRVLLFQVTSPFLLACLLGWMGVAAFLGGIGYALVHPLPRNGRHTLVAAAARITAAGLVGAALDLVFLSLVVGYRAYRLFG